MSEFLMVVAMLCQTGSWVQQVGCQKYYVECLKKKHMEQCVSDFPIPLVSRKSAAGVVGPSGAFGPDPRSFVGPGGD